FFNTEKFPDIIFISREIQMLDQDRARVEGDLELLGVTQALNFELILNKKAPSPRSGRLTLGFSAEGELSRGSHGMDYGSPFISDRVYFQVVAELVRRDK
ncbi:MAG: YceI family protein, partial [Proteobacteria bacterium]|nr:YceI family protein [Pseudomonadota bacterium]